MQQMNIHKTKLVALAEAALALIGMFLAWTIEKYPAQFLNQQGGGQGMTSTTLNGFNSWGWLALIGILIVIVAVFFVNHFSLDFNNSAKMLAIAGFALIAAGALIYFFTLNSAGKQAMQLAQQRGINYTASSGMGLWSTFIAGLVGIAWITGLLNKISMPKQQAPGYYSPQGHYPPPPPQYQQAQYPAPGYGQGNYPPPPPQYPPQQPAASPGYPSQEQYPPRQAAHPPQHPGTTYSPTQPPYPQQDPSQAQGQPPNPPPSQPPANPYI